jgi:hypothetical protein
MPRAGRHWSPMIHYLHSRPESSLQPAPPQRRRVIIVGAGAAGMSAAFHIGEHSLLLERRRDLEANHDSSNDFALGAPGGGAMGLEDGDPDGQRRGVSAAERKALFISCSSQGEAGSKDHTLIHVKRWQPPALTAAPAQSEPRQELPSFRTLSALLRGELRLDAWVVRVNPSQHLLELASGERLIYDKLLCTQTLAAVASLVLHEVPGQVRSDLALRYWLQDRDIEVADRQTQIAYGDVDAFAAGRRVAALISQALADKFTGSRPLRGKGLFRPRLVSARPVSQAGI